MSNLENKKMIFLEFNSSDFTGEAFSLLLSYRYIFKHFGIFELNMVTT